MTSAEPVREVSAPSKRGRETAWDMARSLGVVGVILAATLIFVPGLFHPSKSDRAPAVDYSDYVYGFQQVTHRFALVPRSLPSGWTANAGALTGPVSVEHLHIGWAVPGAQYVGLEESVGPMAGLVSDVLGKRGAKVTGSVGISGATWQTRTSSRGEFSLSRQVGAIAVVVTGSGTADQLQLLASSLRSASS